MCGIVGVFSRRIAAGSASDVARDMADALAHRGPDGEGAWSSERAGIALAHRRLAILDLSETGAQPMRSSSGRFTITYNGEIYNVVELRQTLARLGVVFRGSSDTEVLLESVERWGLEATLSKIAGMFAFGLWDERDGTLTLVRDRVGEKPLYYGFVGGDFCFGSQLHALARHPEWSGEIDRGALALYLRFNYVPGPYSIYSGIRKLPPGTLLTLSERHVETREAPVPTPYWSLASLVQPARHRRRDAVEATEELHALLRTVVRQQMLSDVPVGALLSGGIDSSLVAALMQEASSRPIRTFTMRMPDPGYDESVWAARIAAHLGTEHTELEVTADDALALIPSLPSIYDEPFADSSQIPTTLVARLARQHVTVCLTGDGGDETFCGYNRHVQLARVWRSARLLPSALRHPLGSALRGVRADVYDRLLRHRGPGLLADQVHKLGVVLQQRSLIESYRVLATQWSEDLRMVPGAERLPLVFDRPDEWPAADQPLEQLLWVEAVTSLPDQMLVKVDRATMSAGLEARAPLLDPRIVEFAWSLDPALKVRNGQSKWILRQLLAKHVPPPLTERRKQGFSIPLDRWLRGPLRGWVEELIDPKRMAARGLIDPAPVQRAWREHLEGRSKHQGRLWTVLMFLAWLDSTAGKYQAAPICS